MCVICIPQGNNSKDILSNCQNLMIDLGLISPGVTDVALPVCKWKEIKKIWKEGSVHMVQVKEYIATFKPD